MLTSGIEDSFHAETFPSVAPTGVTVLRGRTLDGIGQYLRDDIRLSDEEEADVTSALTRSQTDVLVSYLPVGSQKATEWYAERAWLVRTAK